MSAHQILLNAAQRTGWNLESMLQIACDYIDNQQDETAFQEHVNRQEAEEEALGNEDNAS